MRLNILVGNESRVRLLILDPLNQSSIESMDLSGWNSLVDIKSEGGSSRNIFVLGIKNKRGFCQTIDLFTKTISNEFILKGIDRPRSMSLVNGQIVVGGQEMMVQELESYLMGSEKLLRKLVRSS